MLAKIYRPAKNAMQSGKAATKKWRLGFILANAPRPRALMGRVSRPRPQGQRRMTTDTKEEAIEFARKHGIPHQVVDAPEAKRQIRAYSDNFAFKRREPWSH